MFPRGSTSTFLQYSLLGRPFRPTLLTAIKEHGRRLEDALRTEFGLSDVRTTKEEERDRQWSKLAYELGRGDKSMSQ